MDITSDTEAFLAAISAAPFDDAPRLIYADWLEENDYPEQAEYLRLVVQLRATVEDEEPLKRLLEIAPTLPEEWRRVVGACFETHFMLTGTPNFMRMIYQAIRFVSMRTATTDAKAETELNSTVLMQHLTREVAEEASVQFRDLQKMGLRMFVKTMQPPATTSEPEA
jgi:uncharacterized protein (TIGR02996 family)